MRIDGLPPLMRQVLMLALPKAADFIRKDDPAPLPPPVSLAPPSTSVQMLVAMAATGSGVERRRKIAAETGRGVDALSRLHSELLAGPASVERLEEIAQWSASFSLPEDPQLASIAREVELRVRVELAKHDLSV